MMTFSEHVSEGQKPRFDAHQTPARRPPQHCTRLEHLDHEGASITRKVIPRADAREDSIYETYMSSGCRLASRE